MLSGLLLALLPALAPAAQEQEPEADERQRFQAPALDGRWLNAGRDLTLEQLRGRVVVLDFWTYCCINCLHMIPVIERLDEHFAREPVHFIGVHANKFPQEGELENIRAAMERHGIHHPVVVDEDQTIWKSYGVRAWPTFVIIDPEGFVYGAQSGELPYELLEGTIQGLLDEHEKKGTLAEERVVVLPDHPPVRLLLGSPWLPLLLQHVQAALQQFTLLVGL